ncbi:MAG: chaperone NapD [Bacteroidota bacterium]
MNISSLVITTLPENTDSVIEILQTGKLCEYHAHKAGKIVVTIEGESVSDEIKIVNQISALNYVISAEMIYSYCEDELNEERITLEVAGKIPDWLNDENAKAEDIKYNGRINL